jgi:hypothetical protein
LLPGVARDLVETRVGRVASLTLYEVTDDELRQLDEGPPDSILLNLAIFCFAAGTSLLPTFFAATYANALAETIFASVTVVAFLAGAILTLVWRASRRSRPTLFARIRERLAGPEPARANLGVVNARVELVAPRRPTGAAAAEPKERGKPRSRRGSDR